MAPSIDRDQCLLVICGLFLPQPHWPSGLIGKSGPGTSTAAKGSNSSMVGAGHFSSSLSMFNQLNQVDASVNLVPLLLERNLMLQGGCSQWLHCMTEARSSQDD